MTKKQLEQDLEIMTNMYKQAHKERMAYFFILDDLANNYLYCADDALKDCSREDFLINTLKDESGDTITEKLKNLINKLK